MREVTFLLVIVIISGCAVSREHILFDTSENGIESAVRTAEASYVIRKYDLLEVLIVSNAGEVLIDPVFSAASGSANPGEYEDFTYRVNDSGQVNLPMVGVVELGGLTIDQAESKITEHFSSKYDQPYVQVRFKNKRAVILTSGQGKVIPLNNEDVSLAEAMAMSEFETPGNATNIRLLRNDELVEINLNDISNASLANIRILPGDVIYVEPMPPGFGEKLRDVSPIISLITALSSITALIISATR